MAQIATAAATVRTHPHQEVIRRVQVHHHPAVAVAAVQVLQEAAAVEAVAVVAEQLVRAEVAIKSYT